MDERINDAEAAAAAKEQGRAPGQPASVDKQSFSGGRRNSSKPAETHMLKISLGDSWASNTVNTVIFRQHGILTCGQYQFTAFYADAETLRLVQRDLTTDRISTHDILGTYNINDAHSAICLGCDGDGFLHLAYDHHGTPLRYRRSTIPLDVTSWTDELPMTGEHENRVTYPGFLWIPAKKALLFVYRDGRAASGSLRIKRWSEADRQWTDHPQAILSGAEQRPWTSNPYWNHPAVGKDGSLHLSFVWRTSLLGDDRRINNINIDYARSPDLGLTWYSSRNRRFELPITQVTSETVWPISPGSNLINQTSMALDNVGNPHIVFYSDDPDGIPQYQHLFFDGRTWKHNFITARTEPFVLSGGGTLPVPISRPEIVIDAENRVYVIYRGDVSGNRIVAQRLLPPDYAPDTTDIRVLWDECVGFSEPVIDRFRWMRDGVLSMFVQYSHQPPVDGVTTQAMCQPAYVVDCPLPELWYKTSDSYGLTAEPEQKGAKQLSKWLQEEMAHSRNLAIRLKQQEARAFELEAKLAEREERIAGLDQAVTERDGRIAGLDQAVTERDGRIAGLNDAIAERDERIAGLEAQLAAVYASRSWRITAPLRAIRINIRRIGNRARVARALARLALTKGPRAGYRLFKERRLLLSSGAFDVDYYRRQYPDVAAARVDPALHYQLHGAGERREPNALFDTDWYLQQNPDVAEAGVNPLVHYVRFGATEGRDPSALFDTDWYLEQHPDVAEAGMNPLGHYLRFGISEGREAVRRANVLCMQPAVHENWKAAIGCAQAASDAKDWPEAVKLWGEVLERFGDKEEPAALARFHLSIARRLCSIGAYKQEIDAYARARSQQRPRIAIYTAVTGGYDTIKLPERLDKRFDYILFTDAPAPHTGVFRIRPIEFHSFDPCRSARYVKTHPHMLLGDYDVAVWIDANILILSDIYPLVEDFLASGKPVGAIPHPLRQSIEEEVEACIRLGKDDPKPMREQLARYREEGNVPGDLIESSLMMFDLRHAGLPGFLDAWWTEIDRHSRRDQLSLNYALKKTGTEWHRLTERPNSLRNHPAFALVRHDGADAAAALIEALNAPSIDPYAGPSYAQVREQRIPAQRNRRIDVVVCVHNALEDVKQCLESVRRARGSDQQRLIIIDDGSDAPTAAYLREFAAEAPWVELHRNDEARGYTRAANQGLAASTGELVILLNSDTVVTDGWAEKLADAVFSTPGAGIVGPLSNAASYQSIPDIQSKNGQTAINELPPGLSPEGMNRYCEEWTVVGILPRVPLVHGFCFGITREAVEQVGFFDEGNFPRGFGEENDYCFRAVDTGVGLVVATHTYVFHAKSKSYGKGRMELARAGTETMRELHGRRRIHAAIECMRQNSILTVFRSQSKSLYPIQMSLNDILPTYSIPYTNDVSPLNHVDQGAIMDDKLSKTVLPPVGDVYYGRTASGYEHRRKTTKRWQAEQHVVQKLLSELPPGLVVADIPFGTGRFVRFYVERSMIIHGLDSSPDMIAQAPELLGDSFLQCHLQVGSAMNLPYHDNSFDLVVCFRFLQNIISFGEAKKVLSELNRTTRAMAIFEFEVRDSDAPYVAQPSDSEAIRDRLTEPELMELLGSLKFSVEKAEPIYKAKESSFKAYLCRKLL